MNIFGVQSHLNKKYWWRIHFIFVVIQGVAGSCYNNHAKRLLGLSQKTYIKRMLKRYHMQDSKPMDTPVDKSLSLSRDMCPKTPEEKEKMSIVPYASAVDSLMYVMMCTRPDICYVVGLVTRYQSNPGQKY